MLISFPLIVIDESTDARITAALAAVGYQVFSIQQEMAGIDDVDVIEVAAIKKAYVVTEDKDFGDEIVFRKASVEGAMLLRLAGVDIEEKIRLVLTAIEKHGEELMRAFAVLSKSKLRIRKLDQH